MPEEVRGFRVGVTLPTFRDDASALEAAKLAEQLGFDGVFCFDHLWPMAQPERPALSAMPLLGAVAASTERVAVGSLVARIGMQPNELLVASLKSLEQISSGRFIAGLGVGDHISASENHAYGIPYDPAEVRLDSLEWCAGRLFDSGVPVWIGGSTRTGSPTTAVAVRLGLVVNLWQVAPEDVAAVAARHDGGVTWGGLLVPTGQKLEDPVPTLTDRLGALVKAGATWVVCAWPSYLEELAEAAAVVRENLSRST